MLRVSPDSVTQWCWTVNEPWDAPMILTPTAPLKSPVAVPSVVFGPNPPKLVMSIPPTGTQWRSWFPERGAVLGTDDRLPPGDTRAKSKTATDTRRAMRTALPDVV